MLTAITLKGKVGFKVTIALKKAVFYQIFPLIIERPLLYERASYQIIFQVCAAENEFWIEVHTIRNVPSTPDARRYTKNETVGNILENGILPNDRKDQPAGLLNSR